MKRILTIVALAVFAGIMVLAGCGDNWLDNAPTVYIKSINIQGDGTGTIEGVATGQVHAVFVGTNTSAESKLVKAQGTSRWTFSVTNLQQGANTVYVIAASGSAYGAPRSWSFVLESEGYDKTFNLNPPASSTSASATSTGSVASANPAGSWAQDAAKPVAQRPFNNYYGAAYGKTGAELKLALKTIISGHTDLGYDGLFTIYAVSDITPDGKIWDIYSDRDGTGMDRAYDFTISTKRCGNYKNEGDCWNREHMIPQSKFGKARPMVSDAHHVLPTDGKVNGIRSSWPHATVGSASFTSLNGSKLGSSSTSGYSGTAFEPINAYKGDTARIYFYFCVRYYNGSISAWESMNSGAKLKSWAQTLYRQWHAADPVSQKEQDRNNGVQQYQKNRNPFIDYPELADLIDFTN